MKWKTNRNWKRTFVLFPTELTHGSKDSGMTVVFEFVWSRRERISHGGGATTYYMSDRDMEELKLKVDGKWLSY